MDKEKEEQIIDEFDDERTPSEILRERFSAIFPDFTEAQLNNGIDELAKQHPETDIADLATDELFAVFAKGRGDDMVGIFEDYTDYYALAEEKLSEKFRRRTNRSTSVGSARNSQSRAGLSDAQYGLLKEWNREHPEYAMTAKEYMAALKN